MTKVMGTTRRIVVTLSRKAEAIAVGPDSRNSHASRLIVLSATCRCWPPGRTWV